MIARFLAAAFVSAAVTTSFADSCRHGARTADRDRSQQRIHFNPNDAYCSAQANQTGNYSVLYGISAPGFQQTNSPERLSQIFANLRAKGLDLSGVAVLEPQLSLLPVVNPNGVMRMAVFFPSVPMQVYFDLQFIGVQGQWRLIGIAVDVGPPTAIAPSAEPPRPAPTVDVRPATAAAPSTDAGPSPSQSAEPKAAPSVDVGKAKPTPTTSVGFRQVNANAKANNFAPVLIVE